MVSWWNDIQWHASMWIIKLNIERKFCTVTPHHLNPVPQIVGIYAAVYSGSRALKGPLHTFSSLHRSYLRIPKLHSYSWTSVDRLMEYSLQFCGLHDIWFSYVQLCCLGRFSRSYSFVFLLFIVLWRTVVICLQFVSFKWRQTCQKPLLYKSST
jgi:hypothetical protein